MTGLYTKPDPDCGKCQGRGTYKRRVVMPALFGNGTDVQTHSVRCPCTDHKPPKCSVCGNGLVEGEDHIDQEVRKTGVGLHWDCGYG